MPSTFDVDASPQDGRKPATLDPLKSPRMPGNRKSPWIIASPIKSPATGPDRNTSEDWIGTGSRSTHVLRLEIGTPSSNVYTNNAELFWVEDLQETEQYSRLGPPKSASEGAERDREWPSTVAKKNGIVENVARASFVVKSENGRRQTYQLGDRTIYVGTGDIFVADSQFLAGVPRAKAVFPDPRENLWNPRDLLASMSAIDRYVAVKALGVVGNQADIPAVTEIAERDPEGRVKLEAAVTLLRLGQSRGIDLLRDTIHNPTIDFLRMEALLALYQNILAFRL